MAFWKPKNKSRAAGQVLAADLLKAVPQANRAATITDKDDGTIMASVPMRRPDYLVPPLSWLLPFTAVRKIQLDRIGTDVFNLCDGVRTVERIVETFASLHKLTFREAQLSISQFMRMMVQRGLIALGRKEHDTGA